jgi:hypothetical protein
MINRIAGYSAGQQAGDSKESSWPVKASDVKQFLEPVEGYITQYPATAVATAFVIGVALAWWIKRK